MTVSNIMTNSKVHKFSTSEPHKIKIYYFSGTGNSLLVAKKIQKKFVDSELIPIAALLTEFEKKNSTKTLEVTADIVGFVFPCHGLTIPVPVKRILEIIDLKKSNYIFAVVTRGGTIFRGFIKMDKMLKKQGKLLQSSFIIDMGMNDPKLKSFEQLTQEESAMIEEKVKLKIEMIQDVLEKQEIYHDDIKGITFSKSKIINHILERLIPFMVHNFAAKVKNYFYVEPNCTSCGVCERVCPSGKIKIINDMPVWNEESDCFLCYSCLNFCPNHAIQIHSKFYMKSYTKANGRYPHPYAKVRDMEDQKLLLH